MCIRDSLMVDIDDRKMLYADGIYDKLYPASLTKLATALVDVYKRQKKP